MSHYHDNRTHVLTTKDLRFVLSVDIHSMYINIYVSNEHMDRPKPSIAFNILAICSDKMDTDQQGLYVYYANDVKILGVDELWH